MSEELTLQQHAENYMMAKLSAAKNELRDAEKRGECGWIGVEYWEVEYLEDVYYNQIKYYKLKVEVTQYILNKLNE